jgi:hypothetical protein
VSWPSQPLAARFADGRDGTAAVEPSVTRFVALICILPLFAQSFYYLLPVAPLYYLSKVWPVLMLPAAAWALTRLQLQSRTIYVIWLAYAIGLTPFISMMQLGAGFFDALTTTVKVWPFTYYFSLLGAAHGKADRARRPWPGRSHLRAHGPPVGAGAGKLVHGRRHQQQVLHL